MEIIPSISAQSVSLLAVTFLNKSSRRVRLWRDDCSWGWATLDVVVLRDKNAYYYRRRLNEGFTRNAPKFETIEPSMSFQKVIDLADGTWISSNELIGGFEKTDIIIVTYTVDRSLEATKFQIWNGIACGVKWPDPNSNDSPSDNTANQKGCELTNEEEKLSTSDIN